MTFFLLVPFQSLKKVQETEFVARFIYWRLCCLRLCVICMFVVVGLEVVDSYWSLRNWRDQLGALPKQLQDKFERFIQVTVAGGIFLCFSLLFSLLYVVRAWGENEGNYTNSSIHNGYAWAIYFFAPFALFVGVPFSYAFQMADLSRDVCVVSLASILNVGPGFRSGFVQAAKANEPELSRVAYYPPPPATFDMDHMRHWSGYTWCDNNKYDWEARIYSTRWMRLSKMSIGLPSRDQVEKVREVVQKHEGVVPGALYQMSWLAVAGLDDEFLGCLAGAATSNIKDNVLGDAKRAHAAQSNSLLQDSSSDGEVGQLSPAQTSLIRREKIGRKSHKEHVAIEIDRDSSFKVSTPQRSQRDTLASVQHKVHTLHNSSASLLETNWFLEDRALAHAEPIGSSIPAFDTSKQAVCAAYASCLGIMKSGAAARLSIHGFLGTYSGVMTAKTLFPSTFSVVSGIADAAHNVKDVLPQATAPGYMLMTAVVSFLPAFLLCLAVFSQGMGNPAFSFAFAMLGLSFVFVGYKGYLMTQATNKKDEAAAEKLADQRTLHAQLMGVAVLLTYAGWMAYTLSTGGPKAHEIVEALESLKGIVPRDPKAIAMMVAQILTKFVMGKMLCMICFTDLLMVSIFDSADDELQAKSSGHMDEDKEGLLKEWHALCPPKEKKHKKHKKDKKSKNSKGKDLQYEDVMGMGDEDESESGRKSGKPDKKGGGKGGGKGGQQWGEQSWGQGAEEWRGW